MKMPRAPLLRRLRIKAPSNPYQQGDAPVTGTPGNFGEMSRGPVGVG